MRTYIYTYIRSTYIYTYIRTYMHAYVHTYIHTHIHTYTLTYIYCTSKILQPLNFVVVSTHSNPLYLKLLYKHQPTDVLMETMRSVYREVQTASLNINKMSLTLQAANSSVITTSFLAVTLLAVIPELCSSF